MTSVIAFGTVFLIPVSSQQIQGHSALATGVALLPQGVVMGLGTALGQRISARVPLQRLVVGGFAALAAPSSAMLLLDPGTPLWVTAVLLRARALAAGFITTPLLADFLRPLRERELADGNTLYTIVQRLGGSVGVSVLGTMVASGAAGRVALDSFHRAGAALAALAGIGALLALALSRPRPGEPVTA